MRKGFCLAILGIVATGMTLATPSESRADHRRRSGFGVHVDVGNVHFSYDRGHRHHRHHHHDHRYYPRHHRPEVIYVVPRHERYYVRPAHRYYDCWD